MKAIFAFLLSATIATLATAIHLKKSHTNARSAFGLGPECRDLGWQTSPKDKPAVYQSVWCYNGMSCNFLNDYVFLTVKSNNAFVRCDTTPHKSSLKSAVDVISGAVHPSADTEAILNLVRSGIEATTKDSQADESCYCFAEKWQDVSAIYATVVSNDTNSITIEVPPESLNRVDSEKIYNGTLLKIIKDSCSNGDWKDRICDEFTFIRSIRNISWSDLARELASLGDSSIIPENLYIFNPNPYNPSCKDLGTQDVKFYKTWCYNEAGCNNSNEYISASYNGTAVIKCKYAYDPSIPSLGSFITTAFLSYMTADQSGCTCYPDDFKSNIAISVADDHGDWGWFSISRPYFDKVGIDQIGEGVKFTTGNTGTSLWQKNIRQYRDATTFDSYDWDDLGFYIAWWGDGNDATNYFIFSK